MKLHKIFKKNNNIIIGAIHLPPLLGYKDFPGFDSALKNALADLKALEKGGVDGIIFENNYDIPHKETVDSCVVSAMTFTGEKIKQATKLPIGVSVLWNDYRAALSIAKTLDLQFIRIPVFVDKVTTDYGIINGNPKDVLTFRKFIRAEDVALFTDIHVKHAKLLSKNDLLSSARLAIESGSDAVILTGKWTGDAPDISEAILLKRNLKDFPIILGSGVDKHNSRELFTFAHGAIVSTSLKKGNSKSGEVNVKSYDQRIDSKKVTELVESLT